MAENPSPLIIFDCDGVLVDSEPISFAVLRDTLTSAGVELSESRAYRQFLGKSMASITRMIADEFSISLSEEHIEDMRTQLFARFQAELQPVAGIVEMFGDFDRPRCVASSSQMERIRLSLTKTGLIDYFEPNIFSATMVKRGKPEPDLFLHAAATMGFPPSRCIVIEDSPAGIQAAHSAGMKVFAFTGGSHATISNLREIVEGLQPTLIFDDMKALPGLINAVKA
ncbi:MAG: Hydrolase [Rhizobium sp.]|nr:Hydrolase [Rhizobium sp.]